jgi:hypothetical protein
MFALEQARADIIRRRKRWQSWQTRLDPQKLVFIHGEAEKQSIQ